MNKILGFFVCFLLFSWNSKAQELNANVSINHAQVGNNHRSYFQTLEKSLKEILNQTSWTNTQFDSNEKIDCNFIFTVSSYENNTVAGSLQVQYTRPVYDTTYNSLVLNFNDKDISFPYVEFEPLRYVAGSYESNLISVLAFYVNIILGMDADTFAKQSGTKYYQEAANIASLAQQSGYKGWKQGDGPTSRFVLSDDLVSGSSSFFRAALYDYHRLGLDLMSENLELGRDGIYKGLTDLQQYNATRSTSLLTRVFFDAKTDELVNIYSGVSDKNKKLVVQLLNMLSPLNSAKWNNL